MNYKSLPAQMENLDPLLSFIDDELLQSGFENEMVNKVKLACEEIIVNVIHYSYPDTEGEVEVRVEFDKNNQEAKIAVVDSGVEFDPLAKEDPDINVPIEERQIGGLGIFMTKKIMDKVEYQRKNNQNHLIMTKKKEQ